MTSTPPTPKERRAARRAAFRLRSRLKPVLGHLVEGDATREQRGVHVQRESRARKDGERNRFGFCGTLDAANDFVVPRPSIEVRTSATGERRSALSGTARCRNAHVCPVCAPSVRWHRARQVDAVTARHLADGGGLLFLTLTVRHTRDDDPRELRRGISAAWSRITGLRSWARWRDGTNGPAVLGYCRSWDWTHGGNDGGSNGAHPHLHMLVFTRAPFSDEELDAFREYLRDEWERRVEKALSPDHRPDRTVGVDMDRVRDAAAVAKYQAKVASGITLELLDPSQAKQPRARVGSSSARYSMWQVMVLATEGWEWAQREARLFYEAMRGAPVVTWSKALLEAHKDLIGASSDEELTAAQLEAADDAAAQAPPATVLHESIPIPLPVFDHLAAAKADDEAITDLLDLGERRGAEAVRAAVFRIASGLGVPYRDPDPPPPVQVPLPEPETEPLF